VVTDTSENGAADLAIKQHFWTITIRDLDALIDKLQSKGDVLAESNYMDHANKIRGALSLVRQVRDVMLAENYDANRRGEVVRR